MIMFWKKKDKNKIEQSKNNFQTNNKQLVINHSLRTDTGVVRDNNEDSIKYININKNSNGCLAIVADGMGGHASGEVASMIAVDAISEKYFEYKNDVTEALKESLNYANIQILNKAKSDKKYHGMGTTCSALVIDNEKAFCAQVGDSRIYLYRNNNLEQITEDQTIVQKMIKMGTLSKQDARDHPQNNILYQAMGTKKDIEVEVSKSIKILPNDRFILCSDGLTDLVKDIEIKQLLEMSSINMITTCLISLAKDKGGHDNISVILLQIDEFNKVSQGSRNTRKIL